MTSLRCKRKRLDQSKARASLPELSSQGQARTTECRINHEWYEVCLVSAKIWIGCRLCLRLSWQMVIWDSDHEYCRFLAATRPVPLICHTLLFLGQQACFEMVDRFRSAFISDNLWSHRVIELVCCVCQCVIVCYLHNLRVIFATYTLASCLHICMHG